MLKHLEADDTIETVIGEWQANAITEDRWPAAINLAPGWRVVQSNVRGIM